MHHDAAVLLFLLFRSLCGRDLVCCQLSLGIVKADLCVIRSALFFKFIQVKFEFSVSPFLIGPDQNCVSVGVCACVCVGCNL